MRLLKRRSNVLPDPLADINNKWVGKWRECVCGPHACTANWPSTWQRPAKVSFRTSIRNGWRRCFIIIYHTTLHNVSWRQTAPPPLTSTTNPTKYGWNIWSMVEKQNPMQWISMQKYCLQMVTKMLQSVSVDCLSIQNIFTWLPAQMLLCRAHAVERGSWKWNVH